MGIETAIALAALIFLAALLYSSVGHAGASGYLASMALFGLAATTMKPTALTLNILVAIIASIKYYRAGCFSWRLFYPFALGSVPFSFLGGMVSLPTQLYKPVVGLVLLYSAYRLLKCSDVKPNVISVPLLSGVSAGSGIGLLSGLTGVGGGIFLSPLLLFMGWSDPRQASGVAAVFILVNSIAALLGHCASISHVPAEIVLWAPAALIGGWLGAQYGSRRLPTPWILRLLAAVLLVAGLKMVFMV